jgi:predicted Zn-dependent protease
MRRLGTSLRAALAAAVLLGAGACTTGLAAGAERFTLFMSPAEEARIGREQHEKILKQFGGAYQDATLVRYVDSIGQFLARTSEWPDLVFTFTVLDTPIVNAFALPGGYVYVTRGLIALADNEAELASVLAHEIGHVAARHAAERYSRTVVAGIGLTILGVLSGNQLVNDLAGLTAELVLKGYSRQQELEADTFGVRYLTRAGFESNAMVTFLRRLQAHDALEAKIRGRPGAADEFGFFSTHPRTVDRINQAIAAAGAVTIPNPIVARNLYLRKIDGLLYGDNPDQGFIKGRLFAHPRLRFRFEVPPGFRLLNSPDQVVALGPEGARILFSGAGREPGRRMTTYLTSVWGRGLSLRSVEAIDVNGLEAATGWTRVDTRQGPRDLRLVAIAFDPRTVYRFAFLTPPRLSDALALDLRRTTYSFRVLSPLEAEGLRPLRIAIATVRAGDTPESLAQRQPFESFSLERFRVLNGLAPGQPLQPGELVKIVTE